MPPRLVLILQQLCLVHTAGHSSPATRSILLIVFHLTNPAKELLFLERTLSVCLLPA